MHCHCRSGCGSEAERPSSFPSTCMRTRERPRAGPAFRFDMEQKGSVRTRFAFLAFLLIVLYDVWCDRMVVSNGQSAHVAVEFVRGSLVFLDPRRFGASNTATCRAYCILTWCTRSHPNVDLDMPAYDRAAGITTSTSRQFQQFAPVNRASRLERNKTP